MTGMHQPDWPELCRALEDRVDNRLRELTELALVRVLEEPERFEARHHPLGMINIDLSRTATHALVVHIWNAPTSKTFIHRHSWRFRSLVTCGQLRERTYRLEQRADRDTHRRCEITYGDEVEVLTTRATCTPVIERERTLEVGDVISIPASPFHSIECLRAPAATVLSAVLVPGTSTEVLKSAHGPRVSQHRRLRCTPREVRSAVAAALSRA